MHNHLLFFFYFRLIFVWNKVLFGKKSEDPEFLPLRAAIKAFMLTIFKPPLQYSWHKTVFLILLVPVQIKLKTVRLGLSVVFIRVGE